VDAPGSGSRASDAMKTTRARQPSLGPMERISRAVETPRGGAILGPVKRISGHQRREPRARFDARARSLNWWNTSAARREARARWRTGSGTRARQPKLGPVVATRARQQPKLGPVARISGAVESTGAAAEPRARWSAPGRGGGTSRARQPKLGPVARISGAVEAPRRGSRASGPVDGTSTRQPKLGRGAGYQGGSRSSGAVEAPAARWMATGHGSRSSGPCRPAGRGSRSSGPWSASAARWSAPGRGGSTRARQPKLGRGVERTGARWRAPGRGSRSSGAVEHQGPAAKLGGGGGHQGAVEAPGHGSRSSGAVWSQGASLGPVERISGAARSLGAVADRQRHQGAAQTWGVVEAHQRREARARMEGVRTRRHSGASGAAASARTSGRWNASAARREARARWRTGSGTRERSSDQRSPPGRESRHGATLGPQRAPAARQPKLGPAEATRARQPKLGRGGGHQGAAAKARAPWGHQIAAADTARASGAVEQRQRCPGAAAEARARWRAPAHRHPSPGPVEATSGAVEAPGRGGGHQGTAAEARARGAHRRGGGGHQGTAAEALTQGRPPLDNRSSDAVEAPGHGSRSSGAEGIPEARAQSMSPGRDIGAATHPRLLGGPLLPATLCQPEKLKRGAGGLSLFVARDEPLLHQ